MKSALLFALCCAFAGTLPAGAASIYSETFSNDGSAEDWFEVSNGLSTTLAQEPVSDVLAFSGTGSSIYYLVADSLSSGGAFSGDYTSAGIGGISFELLLDPGSVVNGLIFELSNPTEGETWQYALTPVIGTATQYFVPISPDGSGWVQTSGDDSFAFLLSQVEEAGIAMTATAAGDLSGHLDSVSTVPEISSAALACGGMALLLRRRRGGC